MPSRSFSEVYRGIHRLDELIRRDAAKEPGMAAMQDPVASSKQSVRMRRAVHRDAAVAAKKEMGESDTAMATVTTWHQAWRSIVMMRVPGAAANIGVLPASGTTPDDMLRNTRSLKEFILENPAAASFRQAAVDQLGDALEVAEKEVEEARAATPAAFAARAAYSEAILAANEVLVRGLDVVRAIYGPTSREYKQFIGRRSPQEETEDADDSLIGEDE